MKAIAIVGFKNSGKTATTGNLADALEKKGLKVAIAKYTHHNLDKPETDTSRFMRPGRTVIGLGPDESALFYGEPIPLLKLIPLIKADILLVEGGKQETWLPRIICLRSPEEAADLAGGAGESSEAGEKGREGRGRVLATVRAKPQSEIFKDVPHFGDPSAGLAALSEHESDALAQLVWERSFALPGLNCGACGLGSCEAFACAVVQGRCQAADCPSLGRQAVEIYSDDRPVALNPFMVRLIASMMKSVAAELKGYRPGADLVIRLNALD